MATSRERRSRPMTAYSRQKAIQADLMRWDDSRGHLLLTGTGRKPNKRAPPCPWRSSSASKKRDDRLDGPPHLAAD